MIDALDYVTIAGSAAAYETLLGRTLVGARLQTGNVGVTFGAGDHPLSSMVFATALLDKAAHLLERRAVGTTRGALLQLSTTASHGVSIALVERDQPPAPSPPTVDEA